MLGVCDGAAGGFIVVVQVDVWFTIGTVLVLTCTLSSLPNLQVDTQSNYNMSCLAGRSADNKSSECTKLLVFEYLVVVIFVSSTCTEGGFNRAGDEAFWAFCFVLIGVRSIVAVFDGVTSKPIALNFCSKSEGKGF